MNYKEVSVQVFIDYKACLYRTVVYIAVSNTVARSSYLNKENEVLEWSVKVGLLLQLHHRVKMLVIDVSINSEQTLQDGFGHRHEVLGKGDSCMTAGGRKRWCKECIDYQYSGNFLERLFLDLNALNTLYNMCCCNIPHCMTNKGIKFKILFLCIMWQILCSSLSTL